MHGPVRIAPIVAADVAAVALVEVPSQLSEEELRAELALPWSRIWAAREEGHGIVAFAVFWHVADELQLLNLATRSDRRRRGIARALTNAVVDYARDNRVRNVLLEVRRSNLAALELYRAVGFRDGRTRAGYYRDGEDAVEMTLPLQPQGC
jgi:ribosomal-protein-alanine N-acetyltransferase